MKQLELLDLRTKNMLKINGMKVSRNAEGLHSLTDMWRAAGGFDHQSPSKWKDLSHSRKFIDHIALRLNILKKDIIKGKRGKNQQTFAHWQIALAYAKYLSPEIHAYVNEAFREWYEEQADPGLKIERGVQNYLKRGATPEWVAERFKGITARNALTSTMQNHNCSGNGRNGPFAKATRAITLLVLGQTPKEIKEAKDLRKSAKTRDHLDEFELSRLNFAETEARRLIQKNRALGNDECVQWCEKAGRAVHAAIAAMESA